MALISFLIAMAMLTIPVLSTEYLVGGMSAWNLGVDYTTWAQGIDFRVGDALVFVYNQDYHDVAKVNGTEFAQCVTSNSSDVVRTGLDTITLSSPGKKWYICSLNDHCDLGMKLVIDVAPAEAPAPAPMSGLMY